VPLRNKYSVLSSYGPEPFKLPPLCCGDYVHTREFGTEVKFYIRRMPRRAKHTGKYGLFVYDPNAHEHLIGVFQGEKGWECVLPGVYKTEFDLFFSPLRSGRKLLQRRCAWCGRELTTETLTHQSGKCWDNSRNAVAADAEAGVF
jgi:hypothetical protein